MGSTRSAFRRRVATGITVVATLALAGVVTVACGADGEGGAGVYRSNGCSACHGGDRSGTALGPSLTWQAGDEVELDDGTTVSIDAAYVERSIVDPSAQITAGWQDTMTQASLSDAEVDELVAYLLGTESLTPP